MRLRAFVFGAVVLTLTALIVFAAIAAAVKGDAAGVRAAMFAGGATWLAALCGLAVFVQQQGWSGDVVAAFAPMVVRLLFSMLALAALQAEVALAKAEVGGMIVVNYLALLVAEILIFVYLCSSSHSQAK